MYQRNRGPARIGRILLVGIASLAALAVLALAGCSGSLPEAGNIGNKAAASLLDKGVRLVDVRTAAEFEAGHIPGAENVPIDQLAAEMGAWDTAEPILLYCATGARSLDGMRILNGAGFESVYNLEAGIVAWDGDLSTDPAGAVAGALAPSASGLPVLYEFYTDW